MEPREPIRRAADLLSGARAIMVLTGAGVSAESGVPTFRDAQTGLWAKYDPEALASPQGFAANPGLVWRWYMERFGRTREVAPNAGHVAIASLQRWSEAAGRPFALFTQNVDDLHERAGSAEVRHLHGNIAEYRCNRCRAPHALREEDRSSEEPPRCTACGGRIRPGVVWFGEMLPPGVIEAAWTAARECGVILVAGTSGQVHPAAQIPAAAKNAGALLIDVNPEPTPISEIADLFLQGPSGEILPRLAAALAC